MPHRVLTGCGERLLSQWSNTSSELSRPILVALIIDTILLPRNYQPRAAKMNSMPTQFSFSFRFNMLNGESVTVRCAFLPKAT